MNFFPSLKLTSAETKILRALSADTPASAYTLEKKARLSHSTALYALASLKQRNIAIAHNYKKRIRWTKIIMPTHVSAQSSVMIHRGKRSLQTLVDDIFTLAPYERFLTLQGEQSFRTWTKVLGERYIAKLNQKIKSHKIIVETVIPSDLFYTQKLPVSFIRSYRGRMTDARIVPREMFSFSSDLAIWKNRVCLMNWKQKIGIEILDEELRNLIISLFRYVQSNERKIDINTSLTS